MSRSALQLNNCQHCRLQAPQAASRVKPLDAILFLESGWPHLLATCKGAQRPGTMVILGVLRERPRKGTGSTGQHGRASGTHEPKGASMKEIAGFASFDNLSMHATNVISCAWSKWVGITAHGSETPRNSHAVRWQ